jgi:hypothetical protein
VALVTRQAQAQVKEIMAAMVAQLTNALVAVAVELEPLERLDKLQGAVTAAMELHLASQVLA